MKLTTLTLSAVMVLATTVTAFATCQGKQRISCAEGSVYDHAQGACVSLDVTG
ncbi:MAG: adenylosuccinate lyase [Pseudomonadota bacterium]